MRQNINFHPYSRRSMWNASSSCNPLSGRILNKMENEEMQDTFPCGVENTKFNTVTSESQLVHTSGEAMLSGNSIAVIEEFVDNQESEVVIEDEGNNTSNFPSTQDRLQCTKSDSAVSNHLEETTPCRIIKVSAKHPCTYPGCNEVFSRPWRLAAHESKHTGHRPFVCPVVGCDKSYCSRSHLKRHTDDVHCGRRRIITEYFCPAEKCSKVFRSTQSVKKHYKLHHSENASDIGLFKCQLCSDTFLTVECLETHKVKKCQGALRETSEISNSIQRKRKENSCSECNKVFPNSLLLRKHMRAEHPSCVEVICSICDKKFASKPYLKLHLQTHLSSHQRKRFECPYEDCSRHYTTNFNLQQHISSKHKGKKFTCMYEECMEKKFATKQKLQEHMTRHLLPPGPKAKKETTARRKRKDTGLPKRSMAVKLSGIQVPYHIEKRVLNLDLGDRCDEKEPSVLKLDPSDDEQSEDDEWDESMNGIIEAAVQHFESSKRTSERASELQRTS